MSLFHLDVSLYFERTLMDYWGLWTDRSNESWSFTEGSAMCSRSSWSTSLTLSARRLRLRFLRLRCHDRVLADGMADGDVIATV